MRILVLGGTWFLGRTLVEQGLGRGWAVTTFTCGRSGWGVDGAQAVHGDRTDADDLARLAAAGPWDAVIDTSDQEPAMVLSAARALEPSAARYIYLSTVNVYRGWATETLTDELPVLESHPDMAAEDEAAAQGLAPAAVPSGTPPTVSC